MGMVRTIKRALKSRPTIEGAGVHLKRAIGFHDTSLFDPFLLLDDFHSSNPADYIPGFPWHPHRGIETITYMLQGKVDHGDSMGNKGTIGSGDVQWMTAGSGIIHQEMPKGQKEGHMWGFQLWANLPASQKMMPPRYRDVKSNQIPEVKTDNGTWIKVVCGEINKVKGPVQDIVTDPEYLDINVPPQSTFKHHVKKGHTCFAYVVDGAGSFDQRQDAYAYEKMGTNYFDFNRNHLLDNETLILFDDGDEVVVTTAHKPVRFILLSGKPIKEPVAWYGPIVMNTQEELRIAFEEYENGTFLKHANKIA
jgi:redox-sensitive bicupin YhaK (pirin superfamily)